MKFPSWMEDLSLQILVRVELINCKRCHHLPSLGQMPLLKFLKITEMDYVRYLSDESYSGDDLGRRIFPLLEKLYLEKMINLEDLLLNVPQRRQVFPCLVSMNIKNCDKLTTLPLLPSLQHLDLLNCNKLTTLPLLQSLQHLDLLNCDKLRTLSLLPSLQHLYLLNCDKLITLPLLPSLQHLYLQTQNESIPEGMLQSRNLPVLLEMEFKECRKLITLPRLSNRLGDLDFRSLKVFRVHSCYAMKYL
ncbi:hypothetical protein NE237_010231 [Protea cynaroides]|uniref:R13L1/DRL21-like LRR repeat region domain-containing protein n=1 Tax=Protea cynaroides TaxID=273540 RepID=A0A9Q0KZC5_9MAGN|nr:hypothetical protein NE237_010231 [Protea cynaroides]